MGQLSSATSAQQENFARRPDVFPVSIDAVRQTMNFVVMSRESFRASSFLDHRAVRADQDVISLRIAPLLARFCSTPSPERPLPLHFILHSGYSGSTFLARSLEALPHGFILKEPSVLNQLSDLNFADAELPVPWDNLSELVMRLLAREYPGTDEIIIKPTDKNNWMGDFLLDRDERTKIVFQFSTLKMYLLQVLKSEQRRRWVRGAMGEITGALARVPFLAKLTQGGLTDGQCAGIRWILNAYLCAGLLRRTDAHRILLLNGEHLIHGPKQILPEVAEFLGLLREDEDRLALNGSSPIAVHAKDSRRPFNPEILAAELHNAELRFGKEIYAAMQWTQQIGAGWLSNSPWPIE